MSLLPDFEPQQGDEYEQLPEPVRYSVSREAYAWLSDEEKARLVQSECEPEW